MRLISFIVLTIVSTTLLNGCMVKNSSTHTTKHFINQQNVTAMTKQKYPPKNPSHVKFYSGAERPQTPYRVIGVATVSKYNLIGKPRNEEIVNDMMKKLAASIGGDALINFNHKDEIIRANVIQFRRILL
ncbi:MAG: hypothetical protein H0W64_03160 [Gammaproteobacteria bacterium]|nr:hypothetical protein [Gammaproteobacteria bacterium]